MKHTINNVVMVGRVVRDPIVKDVQGVKACLLTIVTEWEDARQNKKEECYIDCTAWSFEAENCATYLKKGSFVGVAGRLKLQKWTDKNSGLERTKHVLVIETITYVEKMKNNMSIMDQPESPKPQPKPVAKQPVQRPVIEELSGDELPF